jgi:3'(2'), 5'-bisphosphate nucleotidase
VSADSYVQPGADDCSSFEVDPLMAARIDELTAITWEAATAILNVDPAVAACRFKADRSPVCTADVNGQAAIVNGLSRLLPQLQVVSEEALHAHPVALRDAFALVDPLDGTREFLAGRPEFTVNLAIVLRGRPVIGVIAAPALRTIWRGIVGRHAERLYVSAEAKAPEISNAVRIVTRPWPLAGAVVAVSRSHLDDRTAAFLSRFAIASRIDSGSSLKLCHVAEGSADLYPRLAPICEWDIAAGHAIVAAAGGLVISPDGDRITYGGSTSAFCLRGCIAFGDPSVASRIVTAIPHPA